jgi:hypothetical protein
MAFTKEGILDIRVVFIMEPWEVLHPKLGQRLNVVKNFDSTCSRKPVNAALN